MTWKYKVQRIALGEMLNIPDGDMLVGSNIEPDGKGGFRVVAHILGREDGAPLQDFDHHAAERPQ